MKNGATVAAFEREFAAYVNAKYAIALCNGTATLHTALVALGVKPGDKVATTPLTMSATSIAILQAGAVPVYTDVDPKTWLMRDDWIWGLPNVPALHVSLYGLNDTALDGLWGIDDAAQTLKKHNGCAFTSYSFQASKILALGEGGMLVTDSEELATKAREFSSLGYRMKADQPRIDPAILKSPDYERHHSLGWNYRMNDVTARLGLLHLEVADDLLRERCEAAGFYERAIEGCSWIRAQAVPEGWTHDYWAFTVALESKELWKPFTDAIVRHGGEMPYGAWRLTYDEPAFRRTVRAVGDLIEHGPYCPVAESLQPRLVAFQTNDLASAERNAKAVRGAIKERELMLMADRVLKAAWRRMGIQAKEIPTPDATGVPCS